MQAGIILLFLIFMLAIGVPIAFSFAATLFVLTLLFDVNLNTLLLQGFRQLNSVVLLALPLFIMAGYLMKEGGIARRLVEYMELLVRGRKSGLGTILVLSSGVLGAISGTAAAAVASIGTIMFDPMEKAGYPRHYTAALLGVSSLLGILIPPSITMILFAVVTQQSVSALFAASIGPGILLIIGLIIYNCIVSKSFKIPTININTNLVKKPAISTYFKSGLQAFPAFCMPFIILGGIYGGIFTPTEAAAVTVVLTCLVGFFIYKELSLRSIREAVISAAETSGSIIMILLFSLLIGRVFILQGIPQDLTTVVTSVLDNPIAILIAINVFLIIVGMLIDDVSLTVVVAPLFMPLIATTGVDPIQYGAIVATSVVVAANSPPMAPVLYMAGRIGNVAAHTSFGHAIRIIIFVAIPVQFCTTFFPSLSLAIPTWLDLM